MLQMIYHLSRVDITFKHENSNVVLGSEPSLLVAQLFLEDVRVR